MRRVTRLNPERQWADISIVAADNAFMMRMNAAYRQTDCPTDVLAFPLEPLAPLADSGWSGEVFVNVEMALAIKRTIRWSDDDEMALYLAHALDHLSGATDNTPTERNRMRKRELRWLAAARREGLTKGLLAGVLRPLPSNAAP